MLLRFKEKKTLDSYIKEYRWHNTLSIIIPLKPSEKYSPLMVGGQVGAGENIREMITLPIVINRYLKEYPIIPSTSVKGVFRKITYSIAKRIYQDDTTLRRIYSNTYIGDFLNHDSFLASLRSIFDKHNEDDGSRHEECDLSDIPEEIARYVDEMAGDPDTSRKMMCEALCPICSIYGGLFYRSAILFNPIIIESYYRHMRTHVAIDRKTMTRAGNALFTDHLVMLGEDNRTVLEFMVRDLEPGSPTARLLALTLSFIEKHGLIVGGGKSIGYGLMEINGDETIWYYRTYRDIPEILAPRKGRRLDSLIEFLRTGAF